MKLDNVFLWSRRVLGRVAQQLMRDRAAENFSARAQRDAARWRKKTRPSEHPDCFGSVKRRAEQADRDAETLREPVPSAFSGGRGVLNLRHDHRPSEVRTEDQLVLRRLRKRLRKARGRGITGLGPIRPKFRTVARALVLAGYFG